MERSGGIEFGLMKAGSAPSKLKTFLKGVAKKTEGSRRYEGAEALRRFRPLEFESCANLLLIPGDVNLVQAYCDLRSTRIVVDQPEDQLI